MSGDDSPSGNTTILVSKQSVSDGGIGIRVEVPGPAHLVSTLEDYGRLFGRVRDISAIRVALKDPRRPARLILCGEPGVGKTHIANAYGEAHRCEYPGGTFLVRFGSDPALQLAKLLTVSDREESIADRASRFLASIEKPTLLVYDNVPSESELASWLPGAGLPVHVIVTTTSASWSNRHAVHNVQPLDKEDAGGIVEGICGPEVARQYGGVIIRRAAGIAVHLRSDCELVRHHVRHGRAPVFSPRVEGETSGSFAQAFDLLTNDARLAMRVAALFRPDLIPFERLQAELQLENWDGPRTEHAVDDAVDRLLLAREGKSLRMHSLVARFVRSLRIPPLPNAIVSSHRGAFSAAAELFAAMPGQMELRERFVCYPAEVDEWDEMGIGLHPVNCHTVGNALIEAGRFHEAEVWLRRAFAGKEKGGANGSVDHAGLGSSAHEIGFCLASLGQYEKAKPWFERAVVEKEKGDSAGRVDHENLSVSLHLVATCLIGLGKIEAAIEWCERAMKAHETSGHLGVPEQEGIIQHRLGDCLLALDRPAEAKQAYQRAVVAKTKGNPNRRRDRRIDHESLASSIHQVGGSQVRLGELADAVLSYERAVSEAQKGDAAGRVHHDGIAKSMHAAGYCLSDLGKLAEAIGWFSKAVDEALLGDIHGRIDHVGVGMSMYEVGHCLLSLEQYGQSKTWYERAVSEQEKGDLYGQVDHERMGQSLNQVGFCLWKLGEDADARAWFERGVAETGKGNRSGRVNYDGLRMGLTNLGHCLVRLGDIGEAQRCFDRAAKLPDAKMIELSSKQATIEYGTKR